MNKSILCLALTLGALLSGLSCLGQANPDRSWRSDIEDALPDASETNNYELLTTIARSQAGDEQTRDNHIATLVHLLHNGADVNAVYEDEMTLLILALLHHNDHIAEILIRRGANINFADSNGVTILMGMIQCNRIQEAIFLINRNANLNLQDHDGHTALIRAVHLAHLDLIQLLLNQGADINLANHENDGPMTLAIEGNHVDIVQLFLSHNKSNRYQFNINHFLLAIFRGHTEIVEAFLNTYPTIVDEPNEAGTTALMVAAENGHEALVNYLLELGATITITDRQNQTAVAYAANHPALQERLQSIWDEAIALEHPQATIHQPIHNEQATHNDQPTPQPVTIIEETAIHQPIHNEQATHNNQPTPQPVTIISPYRMTSARRSRSSVSEGRHQPHRAPRSTIRTVTTRRDRLPSGDQPSLALRSVGNLNTLFDQAHPAGLPGGSSTQ